MRFSAVVTGLGLAIVASTALAALPDEIQVYTSDINKPGEFGLELHVNTTPSGRSTPDFPGEIVPNHGWRVTPEFSWGWTGTLEAGLYLPFVHGAGGRDRFAGPKLRLKWLPLQPGTDGTGYFAGLNFEHAWISGALEQATRALEVRPILGWQDKDWLVAFNPILGFDLAGPTRGGGPDFNPSLKVSRRVADGVMLGGEYYAELGKLKHFAPRASQGSALYATIDVEGGPVPFNFGIGRGLNGATDRWTVKAIFAFSF
jgi:hypothetical protein